MSDKFSYWDNDNLERSVEKHRFLISGCGDGALVDLLRVRLSKFRHHTIINQFIVGPGIEELTKSLKNIESKALLMDRRGEPASDYLYNKYKELEVPASIDQAFHFRSDTRATLCTRDNKPLKLKASILHRFLTSRLLFLPESNVELRQRALKNVT